MATMKQALEMAQNLNIDILISENGSYKFSPTIFPRKDQTIYIHASNAAIEDRKSGLEWRMSRHYTKQQYQVRESSIVYHTFPTIPALCGWLENEMKEQEEREAQQKTERAAQLRADKEGVTVYAVRAGQVFFACTYEEIARDHAEDSIQILHTANPTHKPTGEEIASDAKPGDTIVYLSCNGREQEATYKHHTGSGVIADHPDGWEIGVRFSQIRGLKKSGSTPDLDPIEERADFNSDLPIPDYHYTGTKPQQIGGDGPIIGSSWSTAHDNPNLPGYIKLTTGPIYDQQPPASANNTPRPANTETVQAEARATCQVCGRKIKANSGLIAHHGYQRPGDGWQTSSCAGARYVPYEIGCDRLREVVVQVTRQLERVKETQCAFLAEAPEKITVIERRSAYRHEQEVVYERPADFNKNKYYSGIPQTYATAYDKRKYELERTIKAITSELATMERRLDEWKPTVV